MPGRESKEMGSQVPGPASRNFHSNWGGRRYTSGSQPELIRPPGDAVVITIEGVLLVPSEQRSVVLLQHPAVHGTASLSKGSSSPDVHSAAVEKPRIQPLVPRQLP
ncbi:hypothetical protein J1605_001064 [Eschrichtius robustus]|uniref:Uncharacterized protein n=1 Tax=Eschrichtius robustus TaxID=9764 RepID=A0AB34GN91_ESCRO|nr:hypothetical protein J1605_001064 [Eschrichtius robustus]